MSATDAMLARYQAELEEKKTFMDGLVDAAEVRQLERFVLSGNAPATLTPAEALT